MPRNNNCTYVIVSAISESGKGGYARLRPAVSQIKYLLAPHGCKPWNFAARTGRVYTARMNLIEISAVRGDHQSSGGRRAERRKQDGEERRPGFYDLRIAADRGTPLVPLGFSGSRASPGFPQSRDDLASEKSHREKANKVHAWL